MSLAGVPSPRFPLLLWPPGAAPCGGDQRGWPLARPQNDLVLSPSAHPCRGTSVVKFLGVQSHTRISDCSGCRQPGPHIVEGATAVCGLSVVGRRVSSKRADAQRQAGRIAGRDAALPGDVCGRVRFGRTALPGSSQQGGRAAAGAHGSASRPLCQAPRCGSAVTRSRSGPTGALRPAWGSGVPGRAGNAACSVQLAQCSGCQPCAGGRRRERGSAFLQVERPC